MNKNFRQINHKIIAIILLMVITLPIFLQPGHYLFIEHDHHHHQSSENGLSSESEHLNCAIDDFQLTNVTLHTFFKVSQITCLDITLKLNSKQIYSKRELNIPFSLRAPPFLKRSFC